VTAPQQLHGAWRLTRWDYTVDGEFRGYPMGKDAQGQIIYSTDGGMSAILMMANRPRSQARQFHQATPEEREAAALGYVSYGGTWVLWEETVSHHVAFALFPNWIGTDLIRTVTWEGETLVLTSLPESSTSGRVVVNRLFWERTPAAS
jgi:hypothetical protein